MLPMKTGTSQPRLWEITARSKREQQPGGDRDDDEDDVLEGR